MRSLAVNTLRQYNVTYKLWWNFCKENSIDPYQASVPYVMTFLTKLYNSGASYGTLNSHKSALSLISNSKLGEDDRIKRLLKGFYKGRPPLPKYNITWDTNKVLNNLKGWYPNNNLSLENISKKLVILLALSTAHRAQTLSLIKISNIKYSDSGIHIIISDIVKTSGPGRSQPSINLYYINPQNLCPAKTLQDYLAITKDIRNNSDLLILSFKKPHKPVSPSTIGRWIKNVLLVCGINIDMFTGHSTRHAATSMAKSKGVPLDVIRQTAGWTSMSKTFERFYNRPITCDSFSEAIFNQ